MPYSEMRNEVGGLIQGIAEGAERIRKIVQSLKDFARRDPGDKDQSVKLNELTESAIVILSNLIRKTTDNFIVNYDSALPSFKGNAQQLEQVIINLISNACQAVERKDAQVVVTTKFDSEEQQIIMKVMDEGMGISPEDLKHIFDPFFTTKRDCGGTGLGLSISFNIIKDHGGRLTLDSKVGRGTTAIISLPIERCGKE